MDQDKADAVWLKRIAEGDKQAFTDLLGVHLPPILTFIQRYIHEYANAEDIAQEVFTRVWLHAKQWKQLNSSPRSWFYRIAYNLAIDTIRKQKQTTDQIDELTTAQTPEENLIQLAQYQQLQDAMCTLPERQRTALYLCTYQGLSNKEASAIMEVSVDALESLLSRARRALKSYFQSQDETHYETA